MRKPEKIRSLIREDKKACFVLALKEADANATLAVNDQSAIETGRLNTRNDRVTGTLTVKTGELIWSATDHFSDAPFNERRQDSGQASLWKDATGSGLQVNPRD